MTVRDLLHRLRFFLFPSWHPVILPKLDQIPGGINTAAHKRNGRRHHAANTASQCKTPSLPLKQKPKRRGRAGADPKHEQFISLMDNAMTTYFSRVGRVTIRLKMARFRSDWFVPYESIIALYLQRCTRGRRNYSANFASRLS